jgi:hypothetical protein
MGSYVDELELEVVESLRYFLKKKKHAAQSALVDRFL